VYDNHYFRGRLFSVSASLLYFFSGELLKWQFPVLAVGEALARSAAVLRCTFSTFAPQLIRR
jgi:hypothetical protein